MKGRGVLGRLREKWLESMGEELEYTDGSRRGIGRRTKGCGGGEGQGNG